MHAQLVGPARARPQGRAGSGPSLRRRTRYRVTAVFPGLPLSRLRKRLRLRRSRTRRDSIRPASSGGCALDDGDVQLAHPAQAELAGQELPAGQVLGGDDHPGGALVQAVHDPRPGLLPRETPPPRRAQWYSRAFTRVPGGVARGRVHDHAHRLVHDHHVRVLVDHGQGDRLRQQLHARGVPVARRTAGRPGPGRRASLAGLPFSSSRTTRLAGLAAAEQAQGVGDVAVRPRARRVSVQRSGLRRLAARRSRAFPIR